MLSLYNPLDLLLVAFAVIAIPVQSAISARMFARTPRSEQNLVGRYWFTISRAVLVSLLILFDWHWAARPWSALGLDIPVGFWGRVGFGLDAVLVGYYVFGLLLRKLSPERIASARSRLDSYRILPRTQGEFMLFQLMAIVASPFEELLFRGFLIWFFTPFAGLWGAVLISSLIFGLGHVYQGWLGLPRTGLIGLAFGIAYALTHSLWWLMLAHMAGNFFGGLFQRRLMRLAPAPAE